MSYEDAAAVPYGAFTALRFLRDVASVKPGEKVLVVGASGGVGRFAVQIAKHLGAEVTAVCSAAAFELVRSLGADHVIDHHTTDFTTNGAGSDRVRYDVIFDTAGVTSFARSRPSLTDRGRYSTLFLSVGLLLQIILTSIFGGQKAKFTVAMPKAEDMDELRGLMERGVIRPTIARRFPLEHIADAHREVENGRAYGSVVLTFASAS